MIVINHNNDLEAWLDENYCFEDGYINEIKTYKNQDGIINLVEIRLGYQIEGTLQGGTPITNKEYIIKAEGIKSWAFNDENISFSDYCIEGLNIIDNSDEIGIEFEVPELVRLICSSIKVEGPFLKDSIRKPWTSDREVFIYTKAITVPKPSELIQWLDELGFNVSWRYIESDAINSEKVPYPDYSGWFLQETHKIPETQYGVFFHHVALNEGKLVLHLNKYDENIDELWNAITKVFALRQQVEIMSGNCRFNGMQWLEYLNSKAIPEDMYSW